MNSMINFSLEKYYLDLVTAEGHYFIGYSARLHLAGISFNYNAALHDPSMVGVNAGPNWSSRDAPVADDTVLTWRSPRLGFDGEWRPLVPSENLVLHETGNGFVEWNCQQPSAQVQLSTAPGTTYRGLGYVEFLRLTIPPWHLGLQTLLWGRFVSEDHSVVWIEWQGRHALTVLICNGARVANAKIAGNDVKCDDFELSLEPAATIRMGPIGEALTSKIPSVLRSAPVEFLRGREQKYLSRGRLRFVDGTENSGWVIHERVSWGREST